VVGIETLLLPRPISVAGSDEDGRRADTPAELYITCFVADNKTFGQIGLEFRRDVLREPNSRLTATAATGRVVRTKLDPVEKRSAIR
jgi:hypothetical protein